MADIIAEGPLGGQSTTEQASPAQPETEKHAWKIAKALLEDARSAARSRTNNFYEDYRFFLGENHHPVPDNYRAMVEHGWRNRGVRNWLFATIDHKAAVILDAEPRVHIEPIFEEISFLDRVRISSAIQHELRRLNWNDLVEDMFFDGAVTGKGIAHVRTELDRTTVGSGFEAVSIVWEVVDGTEFYPDPSGSRLEDCRYVVWEPVMEMSDVRMMFPDKADKVKADAGNPVGSLGQKGGYTYSDQELIQGTGREFSVNRNGSIESRKARVAWIWVKDDTVVEDIEKKVIREAEPGFECVACGSTFGQGETGAGILDDETTEVCPTCGSGALGQVMLPEITEDAKLPPRRLYPYGRLMVIAGDLLLYDGQNPHQLEEVFPFVEYNHYRIPRRFWGYGDLQLLKSSQRAANRNMSMAIDYMRLCANGMFEFPSSAEAYLELGVGPGQLIQVPDGVAGLARWVHPNGYDVTIHQMVDQILYRDFQNVGGVSDVSLGLSPSSPTSGVEVKARQAAASTRIGQHLRRLNSSRGKIASISWKLMVQHYVGARNYVVPDAFHVAQSVRMDVSTLPANVSVMVTTDPDQLERDNLMGQNIAATIQSGALFNPQLRPFLDLYLVAMGLGWNEAREIKDRVMYLEQMMGQQPGQPGMGPEAGGAPPESPPTGQEPQEVGPQTPIEEAMASSSENFYGQG